MTGDEGSLVTCAVITTNSNDTMAAINGRMPVILFEETWERWLDPAYQDKDALQTMLRPFEPDRIAARPVSRQVNSPKNNDESLLAPA